MIRFDRRTAQSGNITNNSNHNPSPSSVSQLLNRSLFRRRPTLLEL